MASNVDPVGSSASINQATVNFDRASALQKQKAGDDVISEERNSSASAKELAVVASEVANIVNEIAPTSLSFSIEEDLSRMVVAVRAVGSDEIIRQFPPEEFLTVAKFIAAQNPDEMDEDFLKGILFDQHT